jgi:hypothetical protein
MRASGISDHALLTMRAIGWMQNFSNSSAGNPRPVLKICTAAARTHCINDAGEHLQVPIRVVSRDEAMKAIHRRQET